MKTKMDQPALRLVFNRDDPRMYAQSTSGRVASHGTRPALSRSNAMANDSPKTCLADSALRKYPMVVPQRAAKSACDSGVRELRYERRASMCEQLPMGNGLSIPAGDLPIGNNRYSRAMDNDRMYAIRQKRLKELIKEYGNQASLADAIEQKDGPDSFKNPNYISRAKNGKKKISGDMARAVETCLGKPTGWFDGEATYDQPWPFSFPREEWDALDEEDKRRADEDLTLRMAGLRAMPKKQSGKGKKAG